MLKAWPMSEYEDLISNINTSWDIDRDIRGAAAILREFSEGRSGAKVFVIDLPGCRTYTGDPFSGQAILKLDRIHRWSKSELTEAQRHLRAQEVAPTFAAERFPRLLNYCEYDGRIAVLSTVAGGSLNHFQTLLRLGSGQRKEVVGHTVAGMLADWNRDYRRDPPHPPRNALSEWLGYRLVPEQGGRIPGFLEDSAIDPDTPAFSVDGRWMPNPCAFARRPELWPAGLKSVFVRGFSHGDFHGENILANVQDPTALDYFVIDLALFEESAYLFYDPAYLELSHLLHYGGDYLPDRWYKLLDGLCSSDERALAIEFGDKDLFGVARAGREQIEIWVDEHEPHRRPDMRGQAALARVAAGLNFVNKTLPENPRRLALLYAGLNLERYFQEARIPWDPNGPSLRFSPVALPMAESWRRIYDECDKFDRHQAVYVLIVGPGVRDQDLAGLEVLGRIPWALVLDFDPESNSGGPLASVGQALRAARNVHNTYVDNLQEVNFAEATCWFMAAGSPGRPDLLSNSSTNWRRLKYPSAIRRLAERFNNAVSPQQIVVLVLPHGIDADRLRATYAGLDEVFAEGARYILVDDQSASSRELHGMESVVQVACPLGNLLAGLWQLYGLPASPDRVRIPKRGDAKDSRKWLELSAEDVNYLREDLEIIHGGHSRESQDDREVGYDFLRGHPITWTELEIEADVPRDITLGGGVDTPQGIGLLEHVRDELENTRNATVHLYHAPGAGGTTVARRVAWDLKDSFPTVLMHRYSPQTAARIGLLSHQTNLPVLVVMENAAINVQAREDLYIELKRHNTRAVFLYVTRSMRHRNGLFVGVPMVGREPERFLDRYRTVRRDRAGALEKLAHDPEMQNYRSPFFFGLYAFEEKFVHIPDFVRAHIEDVHGKTARILEFLALVTRFSQLTIQEEVLRRLLEIPERSALRLSDTLGSGPSRLVLMRDRQTRVIHPLIAEEVLRHFAADGRWQIRLGELARDFIRSLVEVSGSNSDDVIRLFQELFITRENVEENEYRRNFSELITAISEPATRNIILRELTLQCPDEPHFWNHLGRHHMYEMRSTAEAEQCVKRAIDLDPKNHVHHVTLGMVYRLEVDRVLKDTLIPQQRTADEAVSEIRQLVERAGQCFEQARLWGPESEHGYIAEVQMITRIISRLRQLARCRYSELIGRRSLASDWCREMLPRAEELLRQVKSLQAQDRTSRRTPLCEMRLQEILLEDAEAMICSLQELLHRPNVHRAPIRRLLATQFQLSWGQTRNFKDLKVQQLRTIHSLMEQNLREYPDHGPDIIRWLRVFRRLPEFDTMEAISRLSVWTTREDSLEAHYYLYILHLLRWKQGIAASAEFVKENIERCKSLALARRIRRPTSDEWLGREPEWCPLAHYTELGEWKFNTSAKERFWTNPAPLARIKGLIKSPIKGPQAGTIALGPFDVFFMPGERIVAGRDEGKEVEFYVAFHHEGLKGWQVTLVKQ